MATAPKALFLLCLLLAALVLLSSDTTHALEEHQTGDTFHGDANTIDQKQADVVCPGRCCKYVKHRSSLRCVRCCTDREDASVKADEVVEEPQN